MPEDEPSLRRLGRSLGFIKDPVATLDKTWQHHRREVRRLHEKLFYRPLLSAVARLPGTEARLTPEAAGERLAALGFADPDGALRHLEALTAGVTRTSNIQRTLLPAMLEWFAEAPDPDAGLFGFRRISESLGRSPWYLKTLRDEGEVAQRLATLLATSRYATALLESEPQGVRMLGEDLQPLSAETLTEEMLAAGRRQDDVEKAARAIRGVRRRELLRIASGDLLGLIDVADVGAGLSRLTDATLEATLAVASDAVRRDKGLEAAPTRMAIIAMGRYGGFELSYGSDADVLFVHDPGRGWTSTRRRRTPRPWPTSCGACCPCPDPTRRWRSTPTCARRGSRVRSCARWSRTPPTTRSGPRSGRRRRCSGPTPSWGTSDLRRRFEALIDPLRFPEGGLSDDDVREVRRIKARVDKERLPRGADPKSHLKLGRGGLADIEWTVQLLQMRHAGEVEGLRTPRTLEALAAAREAGLLDESDASGPHRRLASGQPGAQRGRPGQGLWCRPAAQRQPGPRGGRVDPRLPARGDRRDGQRPAAQDAGRRAVVDRVFWG